MDEPAANLRRVAAEQDALLATKLHVPTRRPDRVPRPRLMQLLDRQPPRALTLVCAPAGYGKTVLLAEWVQRGREQPAWLSLDAGDNDPARFWRHLLATMDQVRPGTALRFGAPVAPATPGILRSAGDGIDQRPGRRVATPAIYSWCSTTITSSTHRRYTSWWTSCWTIDRRICTSYWPAARTRRWPWPG